MCARYPVRAASQRRRERRYIPPLWSCVGRSFKSSEYCTHPSAGAHGDDHILYFQLLFDFYVEQRPEGAWRASTRLRPFLQLALRDRNMPLILSGTKRIVDDVITKYESEQLRSRLSSEHASRQVQALYRAQSGKGTSNYPWAVVANNLTLMLADVLELRADRFVASRKGYWGVFDRRAAYFEVTYLVCRSPCVYCNLP